MSATQAINHSTPKVHRLIMFLDEEEKTNIMGCQALFSCIVDQDLSNSRPMMAGHNLVMLGWSWTDPSVLGSQTFGHDSVH